MSYSVIPRWWEGIIEELEHDIERDVSNVVLDTKTLNAQVGSREMFERDRLVP